MQNTDMKEEIQKKISLLPIEKQRQVLEFVNSISRQGLHGIPGKDLTRFAGMIASDDLFLIKKAVEIGCEKIDIDEW